MAKDIVKQAKAELKAEKAARRPKGMRVDGVFGLGILFVCISIAYANYMVFFGTSDLASKIMLVPSSLFVVGFLGYKAIK